MTGIMDAFDAVGWEHDSQEAREFLSNLNRLANRAAIHYAKEMRVPAPLLVTTIKPEGTLSQLPTVSSGLHRSYAPYFIRRIRVSNIDPVCQALQHLGVPNEPDKSKPDRIVFSFPIKTSAKISSADEPAKRQLSRYLTMQECYTDHNSSCTLTVGDDEWEEVVDMFHNNWNKIVACSFLPKYTGAYPQMPYEEITKEQYEELIKQIPDLSNLSDVVNMFEKVEAEEDEIEQDPLCAGGACPIR